MAASPILEYLRRLRDKYARLEEGAVATYIPELGRANPNWFGIAVATVDGQVYEVGDSSVPFTIQSISKPIVFGLAMEKWGLKKVMTRVGVEPSGEAFNSISLDPRTGRPLNPMINAGAIATSSFVTGDTAEARQQSLLETFSNLAGRPLSIDEEVYKSERDTGHRNRAIAHLLRNFDVLQGNPEDPLDLYFRQCSISVTCSDLAVMAAALANGGVNPITGRRVFRPQNVSRLLSIMSTCGMYDFAGEWIFNIGLPAKSGVAGGILAVLPGQLGIGVFSPLLDSKGNSVRGIRACADLSADFGLHLFNGNRVVTPALRGSYSGAERRSKRVRAAQELAILQKEGGAIRIFELRGRLVFASLELAFRTMLKESADASHVIIDFDRVIDLDRAACRLVLEFHSLLTRENKRVYLTGINDKTTLRDYVSAQLEGGGWEALIVAGSRDEALEVCEDHVLQKAGFIAQRDVEVALSEQELCVGLSKEELRALSLNLVPQHALANEAIYKAGENSDSLAFIMRGEVGVFLQGPDGQEQMISHLCAGVSVGEMALVDRHVRSATVRSLSPVTLLRLSFAAFDRFETEGLGVLRSKLLMNLARALASRLRSANAEIRSLK